MHKKIYAYSLLVSCLTSWAMEPEKRPTESPRDTVKNIRELVRAYINKKEGSYVKLPGNLPGSVQLPPKMVDAEVDAAVIALHSNQGYMCADNKIFIVDPLAEKKNVRYITIPRKIDEGDTISPAVSSMACVTNMFGTNGLRILLGEEKGRVLLADPNALFDAIKSFGQVHGKILSFSCHPAGSQIAVRYTSQDSAGLPVPCLGLACAYLTRVKDHRPDAFRRSWKPAGQWHWTDFLTKTCEHEVRNITFKDDCCITECAGTGALEKWVIRNPDTKPELIKVEENK